MDFVSNLNSAEGNSDSDPNSNDNNSNLIPIPLGLVTQFNCNSVIGISKKRLTFHKHPLTSERSIRHVGDTIRRHAVRARTGARWGLTATDVVNHVNRRRQSRQPTSSITSTDIVNHVDRHRQSRQPTSITSTDARNHVVNHAN